MPAWVLALILMLISGFSGLVIGYVFGVDNPPDENERSDQRE